MDVSQVENDVAREEARLYARLLEWGSRAGLALLFLSFIAYVSGLLAPHVPLAQLPELWSRPVADYLQVTASPQGWGWLPLLARGDFANVLGIAVLASCSLPPLLAVIPLFRRQGATVYAIICLLEILVLLLAASGWLGAGH
jgi:hypothetical protein